MDVTQDLLKLTQHTLAAGVLLDKHWEDIKEKLPDNIRHELGGEIAKIRGYKALIERIEQRRK